MMKNKLTENETVQFLIDYLEKDDWKIESFCLGQKHGNDIVAVKENRKLIVEVKGAKADDSSPTKKREYFSNGQIKNHLGKAIVKILDEKSKNPYAEYAIAHPEDKDIRKSISHIIPYINKLDIKHFWVSSSKTIIEE